MTADPGFHRSYNKRVMGRTNPVTLLALYVYNNNTALQKRFPYISGKGAVEYYEWFVFRGREQYKIPNLRAELIGGQVAPRHSKVQKNLSQKLLCYLRTAVSLVLDSSLASRPMPTGEAKSKTDGAKFCPVPRTTGLSDGLARLVLRAARAIVPPKLRRRALDWLRFKLIDLTYAVYTRERGSVVGLLPPTEGFNLVGFLLAEMGLGEGARSTLRASLAAGIRVNPVVYNGCPQRQEATLPDALEKVVDADFTVSIIHLNPEALGNLIASSDFDMLMSHYNIGYWVWETMDFPPEWQRAARLFDEIWTASTFCQEVFSRNLLIPVVRIPHCVEPEIPSGITRIDLGLPAQGFIFLCMADMFSTPERKNPVAAVEAFLRAEWPQQEECYLVIKIINSFHRPDIMKLLNEFARRYRSILLIDGYLDRPRVNALIGCCDCFVSLHRAEGFGLPLAEAMHMGKPVIATGWSGNMDFMTPWNSFPVRYENVRIRETVGSYKEGFTWADPDIDHCTELMRTVVADRSLAASVGDNAAADIRRDYSPLKIGQLMKQRLSQIGPAPGL